jgi:succinyl-diaminopimelate desuccinylase
VRVLELTQELVSIDSQNPGPGEPQIVRYLESLCAEFDLETRVVEHVDGRPNLIVTADCGGGPHLAFSGHLDTKPVGDAWDEWRTDPFRLSVDGDSAYGLGASDMKGAVAAMVLAARDFSRSGSGGSLSLVLTADEEQGSAAGSLALARHGGLPALDAMVIGEPSGVGQPWEALYLVSRGISCFEIEVSTRQGHSGLSAGLGRNAVLVAADLVKAFEGFQPTVADPGPVPCPVTVNPGMLVSGGVCFGTWPGRCTVGVEIRLAPGMDRETVMGEVQDLVDATMSDGAQAEIRYMPRSQGWMPAVYLDPSHRVVGAAQSAAQKILGRTLEIAAYPGGTDATYFMGKAGIPTITSLGPGWLSVAHGPNERVGVSHLDQALALYTALAGEFVRAPGA